MSSDLTIKDWLLYMMTFTAWNIMFFTSLAIFFYIAYLVFA